MTIPRQYTPIHYNENLNIKRKYYKKTDPEYKRKTTKSLTTLKSDKIVKQEPLLEFH